jgi:hypothetical protein
VRRSGVASARPKHLENAVAVNLAYLRCIAYQYFFAVLLNYLCFAVKAFSAVRGCKFKNFHRVTSLLIFCRSAGSKSLYAVRIA